MTAVRNELSVAVQVGSAALPLAGDVVPFTPWMSREGAPVSHPETDAHQHDQQ